MLGEMTRCKQQLQMHVDKTWMSQKLYCMLLLVSPSFPVTDEAFVSAARMSTPGAVKSGCIYNIKMSHTVNL